MLINESQLQQLCDKGQAAAYRLLFAERGIITLTADERRELELYACEWLARYDRLEKKDEEQ